MSNIHGLGSYKKDEKKNNMEEFSQDGKTSGTSVLRPTNGGSRDPMNDLVRQARGGPAPDANIGTINIYANGFKIGDDGEFRETKEPKNQAFLDELKNGNVPRELEAEVMAKWGNAVKSVGINLVDKSSETHEIKFDFKKSVGQSLGSSSVASVDLSACKPSEYKLDESAPSTTIQLVLKGGKRERLKIALSAPVSDVYAHVMHVTNESTFSLAGGFPPKVCPCGSTTIEAAGWKGASVQMR